MNSMTDPTNNGEQINDSADFRDGYAEGFRDAIKVKQADRPKDDGGFAEGYLAAMQALAEDKPASCPDWCITDHTKDDVRDDLVLHLGTDHTDVIVRGLLDAHTLSIEVARTDCPSEGTVGTPALMVRVDAELTTWEQAAELARTILDGFGYLGNTEA